jgi:hypothetical protein
MNIAELEIELAELVKQPFDQTEFALRLLEIYNAPKATLTKLRTGTQNKGEQSGDVLWSRKLFFRVSSDREAAMTLDALKESKATKSQKPRFLLTTDGRDVAAYDTKTDDPLHCDYDKLNDHFDFFLPLAGIEKYEAVAENPADIKAAGRLAKLHDEIERCNPDWLVPEKRHALNQFLTRILFCMFAEDTGSFPSDLFVKTISEFGGADGEHLQSLLKQIFDVMNVPDDQRGNLPAHVRAFPYVNGGLFADSTEVPAFNRRAKRLLVEAAQLDWREINPDIFGSMIQAVVDTEMRGDLGMHYTSVPNIMKVLQPLFLMSLEEEFDRARGHREERSLLRKLLTRISKIRVFDPACGSGNFLIIAYRELRTLEMRILQRLDEVGGGQATWREQSGVKLSSFYGIELADFAAETTKLSLWIAEYQMNQRFKSLFGEAPRSFPLRDGGHISWGNALRLDWLQVCPTPKKTIQKEKIFDLARVEKVHATEEVVDEEAETYIVGNPPYLGGKFQTDSLKEDMRLVFGPDDKFGELDYIACWFIKAANYLGVCQSKFAFVTTNSINQGAQVHQLWPLIFNRGLEIAFAYQPFKWSNNAKGNAAVICTIIGVAKAESSDKKIFSDTSIRSVRNINAYLIPGTTCIVNQSLRPLSQLPPILTGNSPYDGGNLILSRSEKNALLVRHPEASNLLRRLYGAHDFLNGIERWCLWIADNQIDLACAIPEIRERIDRVAEFRRHGGDVARGLVEIPHRFRYTHTAKDSLIILPRVSSERRSYIPFGFLDATAIVSDSAQAIYDAEVWVFSVISSRLHMAWVRTVSGRLKTDIRYSSALCYNTFPLPNLSLAAKNVLEEQCWSVIAAREQNPGKTLAQLYDPETMPAALLESHRTLDETLEKIYIGRPFKNDTERLEHLFDLYAEMTSETHKEAAFV